MPSCNPPKAAKKLGRRGKISISSGKFYPIIEQGLLRWEQDAACKSALEKIGAKARSTSCRILKIIEIGR
jgi:hypothetical protein